MDREDAESFAQRRHLLATLPGIFAAAKKRAKAKAAGQRSLFDFPEEDTEPFVSPSALENPAWADEALAEFEREHLGFYLTWNPIARHFPLFQAFATHDVGRLAETPELADVSLGGVASRVEMKRVKSGNRMTRFTIDDGKRSVPAILWGSRCLPPTDRMVAIFSGEVRGEEESRTLIVRSICPIESCHRDLTNGVNVRFGDEGPTDEGLEYLSYLAWKFPGNLWIRAVMGRDDAGNQPVRRVKDGRIRLCGDLIRELCEVFGDRSIYLTGPGGPISIADCFVALDTEN